MKCSCWGFEQFFISIHSGFKLCFLFLITSATPPWVKAAATHFMISSKQHKLLLVTPLYFKSTIKNYLLHNTKKSWAVCSVNLSGVFQLHQWEILFRNWPSFRITQSISSRQHSFVKKWKNTENILKSRKKWQEAIQKWTSYSLELYIQIF